MGSGKPSASAPLLLCRTDRLTSVVLGGLRGGRNHKWDEHLRAYGSSEQAKMRLGQGCNEAMVTAWRNEYT